MQEHTSKTSEDHTDLLTIMMGVIFILLYIVTEYDHVFLGIWKALYLPQALLVSEFSKTFLGKITNDFLGHSFIQTQSLPIFLMQTPAKNLNWGFCWKVSEFLGKYVVLLFIPWGAYITFKTYQNTQGESDVYKPFKNAAEFLAFAKKHFLEKFRGKNNPANITLSKKPFYPASFCGSLSLHSFSQINQLTKESACDEISRQIDEEKLFKCFMTQLGEPFNSIELLIKQPYGWVVEKILKFIPPQYHVEVTKSISQGHKYDSTVLVSLLEKARRYGVVPNMLFVSLKQSNTALWYGLMNVGRKTFFLEGAGISAQYEAEKKMMLEKQEVEKLATLRKILDAKGMLGSTFKNMEALMAQSYGWVISRIIHYIPEFSRDEIMASAITNHHFDATVIVSLYLSAIKFCKIPKKTFTLLKKDLPTASISSSASNFSYLLWDALMKAKTPNVETSKSNYANNEILDEYFYEERLKKYKVGVEHAQALQVAIEGFKEAFYNEGALE